MPATVSLPLDEYDNLRNERSDLLKDIADLKKQLIDAKMAGANGEVGKLVEMTRAAMKIIGFAMANCSPEITKSWPYVELATVGTLVENLPDCNPFDTEFAREMVKYAREAEVWEQKRKQMGERYVPPPAQPPVANAAKLAEEASAQLIESAQLSPQS